MYRTSENLLNFDKRKSSLPSRLGSDWTFSFFSESWNLFTVFTSTGVVLVPVPVFVFFTKFNKHTSFGCSIHAIWTNSNNLIRGQPGQASQNPYLLITATKPTKLRTKSRIFYVNFWGRAKLGTSNLSCCLWKWNQAGVNPCHLVYKYLYQEAQRASVS